jgi:hypothetical protein
MNPIIGCDAHRRYSLFAVLDTSTLSAEQTRVNHQPGAILELLSDFPEGTPVALETVGNYYWIVSNALLCRDRTSWMCHTSSPRR